MRKRKNSISTSNKEVYKNINALNFIDEVVFRETSSRVISNVLHKYNKNSKEPILIKEKIGNIIVVKKLKPVNFNVYLKWWMEIYI